MKELHIKTSKGEFVLVDGKDTITERLTELLKEYGHYAVVKEMTEEQFAEVVDSDNDYGVTMFQNYATTSMAYFDEQINAEQSFTSLVRSLGWYLWENPLQGTLPTDDISFYESVEDMELCKTKWQEAESKTMYNPILIRKV